MEQGFEKVEEEYGQAVFQHTDWARKHLLLCAIVVIGEICAFSFGGWSVFWSVSAIVALVTVLFAFAARFRYWPYLALFLLAFVTAQYAEFNRRELLTAPDRLGKPLVADCVVEAEPTITARHVFFPTTIEGLPFRAYIPLPDAAADSAFPCPAVGETWRCRGWIRNPDLETRRRTSLWIGRDGATRLEPLPHEFNAVAFRLKLQALRRRFAQALSLGIEHNSSALTLHRAILLGERANIPRATRETFAAAGTVHIFAISGLHVMVIAGLLRTLLMLAFFPLRWLGLVLIPALWFYVLMIGFPPSAVRAAAMASFYFAAPIFFRRPNSLVAWANTFIVFHLLAPERLFDVGSQLSFTVMLGILLFLRWVKPLKSRWLENLGVSVAAWAAGVGIAARVFSRITPGGLIANLIMIPICALDVVLCALGAMFGWICPYLAAHFNNAAALLTRLMMDISYFIGRIPGADWHIEPWTRLQCFAWYAVIALSLWLVRSVWLRHRRLAILTAPIAPPESVHRPQKIGSTIVG